MITVNTVDLLLKFICDVSNLMQYKSAAGTFNPHEYFLGYILHRYIVGSLGRVY